MKKMLLDYAISTVGEKNSVVILMHDAGDKILTYEMLPHLVSYFRENGYSFKNIYDLLVKENKMDGIVIIDKEKGCTSHDVVRKVKKILNESKVRTYRNT